MAKPSAPREREMDRTVRSNEGKKQEELVKHESSVQYKNSIEKINRSQDRDIERALRQ